MTDKISKTVTICNQRGLHARASAKFVKLAETFDAEVTVTKAGTEVSGKSIMGLLVLAAGPGTEIEIAGEGAKAGAAVDALINLVTSRFGEDE
ncbi:MAG: HPr family phosphocarrier protein [Alphaproteobacteria bacterium]|nr:HPr family phosphocarrier protein [Alphaproteobacteria bacterium SS10]